jgi:hypothetical protein
MNIKSCLGYELELCEFCKVKECDRKVEFELNIAIYKAVAIKSAKDAEKKLRKLNAALRLAKE